MVFHFTVIYPIINIGNAWTISESQKNFCGSLSMVLPAGKRIDYVCDIIFEKMGNSPSANDWFPWFVNQRRMQIGDVITFAHNKRYSFICNNHNWLMVTQNQLNDWLSDVRITDDENVLKSLSFELEYWHENFCYKC